MNGSRSQRLFLFPPLVGKPGPGLNARCGRTERSMPSPDNWSWKRWNVVFLGDISAIYVQTDEQVHAR